MEVHHHDHVKHDRKWKQYLSQFLMLFVAVLCGTFAEYELEHKIEKDRGVELAHNFYDELQEDSIVLQQVITNRLVKENSLAYISAYIEDSSLTVCSKPFVINYLQAAFNNTPSIFEPTDVVLEQLKNSGALRYFKNKKLQKLAGDLSVCIANIRRRNTLELNYANDYMLPFIFKHNDSEFLTKVTQSGSLNFQDALSQYASSKEEIPFQFYHAQNFDKVESANMIIIYQSLFRVTRQRLLNEYIMLNTTLLDELRNHYKIN